MAPKKDSASTVSSLRVSSGNSKSKGVEELSKAEENQLDATLATLPGQEKVEMLSRVEALYAKACEANQKRAQRFGTEYKPPNRYVILRDELKRKRQNPAAIKEELRRLKEREIKYNINQNTSDSGINLQEQDDDMDQFFLLGGNQKQNNKSLGGGIEPLQYKTEEERIREEEKRKKRQERFQHIGENGNGKDEDENENQRTEAKNKAPDSIFCSTKLNGKYIYQVDDNRTDFLLEDEYVKRVYNKIHLYAIDTREFLTIRTIDVMNLFHAYNPTYVEWLGSKSCNIEFNTEEDAVNALNSLAVPAPSTKQMLIEMKETLEYARKMKIERKRLAKLSKNKHKNRGRITTLAQLNEMMGIETMPENSQSIEGKNISDNNAREGVGGNEDDKQSHVTSVLEVQPLNDVDQGKGGKIDAEDEDDGVDETEGVEIENEDNFRNLAIYGWYIGVSPMIKIYTDEYGAKGTAVRFLLRYATTNDLYRKPSEKRKRRYKYKKNITIDDPEMYKKLFQIGEEDMIEDQQQEGDTVLVSDGGNGENNGKTIVVEEGIDVNAQGLMEGESKPKRQKLAPVISPMSSKRVAGNMKLFGSVINRVNKDKELGVYKNRSLKKKPSSTTESEVILEETHNEKETKEDTEVVGQEG